MSTIPPNLVGPIIQSGAAQKQAARALQGERAPQSNAVVAGNQISETAAGTVGDTDHHARVPAAADRPPRPGARPRARPSHAQPPDNAESGIRRDDDGQLHVDLEA